MVFIFIILIKYSGLYERQETVPQGTPLFTGDDTFVIDGEVAAGTTYNGLAGSDTYVIQSTLDENIIINDVQGSNKIVFEDDVRVSSVTADRYPSGELLQIIITLQNGSTITVRSTAVYEFVVKGGTAVDAATFLSTYASGFAPDNTAPVFGTLPSGLTLDENADGSSTAVQVGTVTATDVDPADTITYAITSAKDQNDGDVSGFEIDANGNITYTGTGIDAEAVTTVTLTITASDGTLTTAPQTVVININDINDVDPVITSGDSGTALTENTLVQTTDVVYTATGTSDATPITWDLIGTDSALFQINSNGEVTFVADETPDYENKQVYTFTVVAISGALRTEKVVTIDVTNLNDTAPSFVNASTTSVSANENDTTSVIFDGTATPEIAGSAVTYQITSGGQYVEVDASGAVRLKAGVDRESVENFEFILSATSGGQSATHTVLVNLQDVNDIAPEISRSELFATAGVSTPIVLTDQNLAFTDGDVTDEQPGNIVYTIGAIPTGITIINGSSTLNAGGTFTHQDILDGLISITISDPTAIDGLTLRISDGTNQNNTDYSFSIAIREIVDVFAHSTRTSDKANTIDFSDSAHDSKNLIIDAGDDGDHITGAGGSDVITGGLGNDTIILDKDTTDGDSEGKDTVVYNFSSGRYFSAADGGDVIHGFKRGEDVFLLKTVSNEPALQTLNGFLEHVAGQDKSSILDDLLYVAVEFSVENSDFFATGVTFHFPDAGLFSGGRLANGFVSIYFDEKLPWADFMSLIEITDPVSGAKDVNFAYGNRVIKDLTVLPKVFGEGSLAYEVSAPPAVDNPATAIAISNETLSIAEDADTSSGIKIADLVITDSDGGSPGTLELAGADASKFELRGTELWLKAGETLDHETTASLDVRVQISENTTVGVDVTVSVTDVNEAPSATPSTSITIDEAATHTFAVADFGFTDPDAGAALASITFTSLPTQGTLKLNGSAISLNTPIQVADITNLVFEPADTVGGYSAEFTYTVNDGTNDSAPATLTITVTGDDDLATAINLAAGATTSIDESTDTSSEIKIGDIEITDSDAGAYGTLQLTGTNADKFELRGTELFLKAGTVLDHETDPTLTIRVQLQEDSGVGTDISITISDVNESPTASPRSGITTGDKTPYTFAEQDFGFADPDGDSLAAIVIVSLPASGTLSLNGSAINAGHEVLAAEISQLVFTPVDANAAADVTFTYRTKDGDGLTSEVATLTIAVTNETVSVQSVRVLGSNDDDGDGDHYTFTMDETSSSSLTEIATIVPTPGGILSVADFTVDDARFEVYDAGSNDFGLRLKAGQTLDHETDGATVTVTVTIAGIATRQVFTITLNDVNDEAPQITSSATGADLPENTEVSSTTTVYTATGSYDVDAIIWSLKDNGNADDAGLFEIDPTTGDVTFKANTTPDFEGQSSYTFTVVATSGSLAGVEQTVTINVTDQDDPVSSSISDTSHSIDEADNVSATTLATITVTDQDGVSTYSASDFSITGDASDRFEVIAGGSAGEFTLQIKAGSNFDHEAEDVITLTVSGPGGDHSFTLNINDVDEGDAVYVIDDADNGAVEAITTASVGDTVYGRVQTNDPDGNGTPSYQWMRKIAGAPNFVAIVSATTAAYILTAADAGAELKLVITYTDDSGENESVETGVINVPHVDDGDAQFSVTSDADRDAPKVGDTLTANLDVSDPDGNGTFSYQWYYVGGANIAGATNATYIIDAADVGQTIGVRVTYNDGEGHSETVSAELSAVAAAATSAPSKLVDPTLFSVLQDASPNDENTVTGTNANEILQGGNKADTITTGGGDDIVIGGYGSDTITLGAGAETIVYRFSSDGTWRADDGGDTINEFDRGTDKIVLIDTGNSLLITIRFYVSKLLLNCLHFRWQLILQG